ncbi:CoA-disulfide reductase [Clostridium septicum]|uniref:CoA-disulfide reductase n=1 Tax=Clostridium septicum TaxID=1504 RepID=A0A9N7JLQ3_CLOSE|nr:CoA-disulfide reductase [Clostridium septicum]AYE34919.1 CoA-disulfide reductase [Clostridium septicum]MDU1313862.1 CoA-disulfide reductase [Clostridium septicum]QAS60313.1 CoA-disulfide reductase [Clostridium septicum]UEC20432.1 CoA-disulfide reductase [Clostridium septicum]USS01511.1 CoA-disulfide reductase [Clostridium septicum]
MNKKVLIVGGVAGGASAAARLRRLNENIEIIVFEKGEYISFANCGLPYYVGESIKERDALLLQTPEKMKARFNIDVRINSEVISIDANKKTIKVNSRFDGEYEESYDYLVLSPGAKPIKPNLPGIDSNKIFQVRNLPDIDNIKQYVDNKNVKNAVVIGGGFIGIEMTENLKERGIQVTLIEAAPHILTPLDSEFSALVEKELNENGISIILEDKVIGFDDRGLDIKVKLSSGKEIVCDMIVSAIGVTPDTEFIKGSGIELGERGHIKVDEHMRTNKDGVFAVGDAISVRDFVNGNEAFIPLAGPANRQGRIVADNIANIDSKYKGTLGTSIIKVFDMVAATTGNNERTLKRYGIKYNKVYLHPMSHAGYYPNSTPLTIKVLYDFEGKILGAQALGYEGVDKFIDVIATTINFGGTINDLTELELAYAPPFLSAKSPANMAGFMAQNQSKSLIDVINIDELKDFNPEKSMLLDVRDKEEVINGAIKDSINIPVNNLRENLDKLDKDKEILIYCAVGIRGYIAGRILTNNGFKVKNLNGGYKTYSNYEYRAKEIKNEDKINNNTINKDLETMVVKELNATGLSCPGPLMQVKATMDKMNNGDILKVKVSDEGFYRDIEAWTKRTRNELLCIDKNKGIIEATIKKGLSQSASETAITTSNISEKNGQTMVVFSGDLDKAIASFIIANGAAAMGKKVTMLFTFWGLNILRKQEKIKVSKNIIEKAFGIMMPRGSKKLGLSKMNMCGIGSKMIRGVMNNKNIQSLEDLMQAAIDNGIEIVACTMSMDVMGIKKEELIDGITYGGVGYYLGEAEEANVNLFI